MIEKQLAKNELVLIGPLLDLADLQRVSEKLEGHQGEVILVDGACQFFTFPLPQNWRLIGDADSSGPEHKQYFDTLLSSSKDLSDLSHALHQELPESIDKLWCAGFSGGRLDHELMNLGELSLLLEKRRSLEVRWGENIWARPAGQFDFDHQGLFSLFSLKKAHFSLEGQIKWPLKDRLVQACESLTLSNNAHGEFSVKCDCPFFIYTPKDEHERK